jgi:hypothetical protein
VVVQSVERFAPTREEIEAATAKAQAVARVATAHAQPMRLRVAAEALSADAIDELRQMIEDSPGAAEVWIDLDTSAGTRRLRLGPEFRVQHTPTLRAELEQVLARSAPISAPARPASPPAAVESAGPPAGASAASVAG